MFNCVNMLLLWYNIRFDSLLFGSLDRKGSTDRPYEKGHMSQFITLLPAAGHFLCGSKAQLSSVD